MGGDLLARLIREAMSSQRLDRRAVVDRLGVTPRQRSRWFGILDRLRAGSGGSAKELHRFAAALGLDPLAVTAAVADDEGDELHRYERWEAWAWEPATPDRDRVHEHVRRWFAPRHVLHEGVTRDEALAFARRLARTTGHTVSVAAFRSRAALLYISPDGSEAHGYVGGVPVHEACAFRLRSHALREGRALPPRPAGPAGDRGEPEEARGPDDDN